MNDKSASVSLVHEAQKLVSSLSALEDELSHQKDKLEESMAYKNQLQQYLKDINKNNEQMRSELKREDFHVNWINDQNSKLRKKTEEVYKNCKQACTVKAEIVSETTDSKDGIESGKQMLLKEYSELEERIEELNCRLTDATKDRNNKQKELSDTQENLTKKNALLKMVLQRLEEEEDVYVDEDCDLVLLEDQMGQSEEKLKLLMDKINYINENIKETKIKIEEFDRQHHEKKKDIKKNQTEVEFEITAILEENKAFSDEEISLTISSMEQQSAQLTKYLEEQTVSLENLSNNSKTALKDLRGEVAANTTELAQTREQCANAESLKTSLFEAINEIKSETALSGESLNGLKAELEALRTTFETLAETAPVEEDSAEVVDEITTLEQVTASKELRKKELFEKCQDNDRNLDLELCQLKSNRIIEVKCAETSHNDLEIAKSKLQAELNLSEMKTKQSKEKCERLGDEKSKIQEQIKEFVVEEGNLTKLLPTLAPSPVYKHGEKKTFIRPRTDAVRSAQKSFRHWDSDSSEEPGCLKRKFKGNRKSNP